MGNVKDYIVLENIFCIDADGTIFEFYPKLLVRKDIERDHTQNQISHSPYDWTRYFQDRGLFLPSFALSCNILKALYKKRSDPEVNKVLMQYKDKGNGTGWQAQNTVVDWGTSTMIHYPDETGVKTQRQSVPLPFKRKGIKDMSLEKALKNENCKAFVQNLTGLIRPEILVGIGEYFGKPAYVWTSLGDERRAAWLGCYSDYFNLNAYYILNYSNAARGVRAEE